MPLREVTKIHIYGLYKGFNLCNQWWFWKHLHNPIAIMGHAMDYNDKVHASF
jgi:hypothetical protein